MKNSKRKITEFVKQLLNVSGEKANYQKFWLTLIRDVFDIERLEQYINFEIQIKFKQKNRRLLFRF